MGKQVDWGYVLQKAVEKAEEYRRKHGLAPTLRGLFYILVSEGVLPNTHKAYQTLSEKLADARYKRSVRWDIIRDETRPSNLLEKSESAPRELSPEELRSWVERILEHYATYEVNPWRDQPRRVIIVVEKEAQFDLVNRVVREAFPYGVYMVRVTKGYDSATKMFDLVEEIERLNKLGYEVVIKAITDYDPSGEDIVRDLEERIRKISPNANIRIEKVAVTLDQIIRLSLPAAPETAEELEKLRRDPRFQKFVSKLQSNELPEELKKVFEEVGVIRVELDALAALKYDEFVKILRESIEREFDWKIYEEKTRPRIEAYKAKADEVKKKHSELLSKIASSFGTSP